MKKIVLGSMLALIATGGALYAYRTVQVNANRGDRPFTFVCPMSGQPIGHGCFAKAKAEQPACCPEAAHPACCKKAEQAAP